MSARMRVVVMVGLMLCVGLSGMAQMEDGVSLSCPVLTTSAGQSADASTLNILMDEAGLLYDYCDVPTVELLAAGVGLGGAEPGPGFHVEYYTDLSIYPQGTAFSTVIYAIGASLKGMGASGLTLGAEVSRLGALVDYCTANGITIVALHMGGTSARGAAGSDSETMIDAVAPFADIIIVTADGNADGRFDAIAAESGAALYVAENALAIVDLLAQLFVQ